MDKKDVLVIVAVLVLLGLGAAFYFYQQPKTGSDAVQIAEPSYAPQAPLENKPDINPINKTNPFKGIKTNPFE